MALISQAVKVQKAVKNVGRLREIVSLLASLGFSTLIEKIGLKRFVTLTRKKDDIDQTSLGFLESVYSNEHVRLIPNLGRFEFLAFYLTYTIFK